MVFALSKSYGAGESAYARPIAKPVAGTVLIAVDGEPLASEDFAVNVATGVVTFETPPALAAVVSAGFAFDTPVRFDLDRLDLALDGFGAGHALSVPVIEIRI